MSSTSSFAPKPVDSGSTESSLINSSRYSRLHLASTSPDWMPSLANPPVRPRQQPQAVPSAPAPVATQTTTTRGANFLSMFYRRQPQEAAGDATATRGPQPPAALGASVSPHAATAAMPVDVAVTLDAPAAEAHVAPRRTGRPLALGSDTWNALGGASLARARPVELQRAARPMPPASIDTTAPTAPLPVWGDAGARVTAPSSFLPHAAGGSRERRATVAPTLEAFRTAGTASHAPEPPKPITTSPLRDEASTVSAPREKTWTQPLVPSAAAVAARKANAARPVALTLPADAGRVPLMPVGEDAPETPVLKDAAAMAFPGAGTFDASKGFFRSAQMSKAPAANPLAGLTFSTRACNDSDSGSDDDASGQPASESSRQGDGATTRSATQRAEAQAQANTQNFLSTIFSTAPVAPSLSVAATAGSGTSPAADADSTASSKSTVGRLSETLKNFNPLAFAIGNGRAGSYTRSSVSATPSTLAVGTTTDSSALSTLSVRDASPAIDYSSYFSTAFDELEDDNTESLDHLKRVISIVLQTAKQQQADEAIVSSERAGASRSSGEGTGSGVATHSSYTASSNPVRRTEDSGWRSSFKDPMLSTL